MPSNSAEYQRAYRARKRTIAGVVAARARHAAAEGRIAELEAEVKRLKQELAARPAVATERAFSSRPFTPAPKVRLPGE